MQTPPPDEAERLKVAEERFVLKILLGLFALAGIAIAALTLFGGGVGGD